MAIVKDNKKINPIISDKEAKQTKVNLQTTDGKSFGEVSASAYSAIRGNYLDKYSPVDDSEKKALDGYKKYVESLQKEAEKNSAPEEIVNQQTTETKPAEKDGFFPWLGKQAMAGLGQFNKSISSTLDFLLPTEFLGRYDFISSMNDYYTNANNYYAQEAAKSSASRGKGWNIGGDVVAGTVAALPNAILAYMSAGTSLGAQGTSTGLQASSAAATAVTGSTAKQMLGNAVKTVAKNPMYWSSFLQTVGTDYEEAKANGANEFVASSTAILTSLLNAGVEVTGGIETLPTTVKQGGKKAVLEWVKSSLDEGKEEVIQGLITNSIAKMAYDSDRQVFNPEESAKEFALGTAIGGILGGGQTALGTASNGMAVRKTGKAYNDTDTINGLIEQGLQSPQGTESRKIAEQLNSKVQAGKKISDAELGELVYANEAQIAKERATEVLADESTHDGKVYSPETTQTPAPVSVPTTTQGKNSVEVGDVFRGTTTGNTVRIISKNDNATTVVMQTTDGNEVQKEFSNDAVDALLRNSNYEFISADESAPVAATSVNAENADAVLSPQTAQTVNILVSNLKREAESKGYDLQDFYKSTENINAFALTKSDVATIYHGLQRVFAGKSTDIVNEWFGGIAKYVDTDTLTSINSENMHVTDTETVPVSDVTNTDVDNTDNGILTLSHNENVYSLFKDSQKVIKGVDIITDGKVAIPYSEQALSEIKKVYKGTIAENENISLAKLYHKDNPVVIQGNPKVCEAIVQGEAQEAYAFIIDGRVHSCLQKFVDAFNSDGNTITASYSPTIPWTVHNESGNLVGLFMPLIPYDVSHYENLPTVSEVIGKNAVETEDKNRSLATAENANALSSTPSATNSTTSDDSISQESEAVNADAENETNLPPVAEKNEETTTDVVEELNLSEGEILSLKHTKNPYSVFKNSDRMIKGIDMITDGFCAFPYSEDAMAETQKVFKDKISESEQMSLKKIMHEDNDVIIQGNPKVVDEKNGKPAYAFIIGDKVYMCQQKYIDAFNNNGNVIKANSQDVRRPWNVYDENGSFVALFMPMMSSKVADYAKYKSVNELLAEAKQHKEELAKRTFNQTEVRNIVKNNKVTQFEMGGKTFVSNGKFIIATDESGLKLLSDAYGEIDSHKNLSGTVENILKSDNVYAENVKFDGESLYHDYNSGTLKSSVAVVNGEALSFPKKYVDMIKKRSKSMSILNTGTAGAVCLVGYDNNGNAIGLTTAIDGKGDYTTKSGDVVPFANISKLRKTPDIKPEVPKYNPKPKMSIDTKSQSNTSNDFTASPQTMEHFSNQISEWQNGTMKKSEMFELGDTPLVLKSLGADDLPVVMTQKVMEKITGGKHNIAVDTIKNIPQAITDPVMVFNSDTVDNAFVILTELTDVNGNDVIVAMHLSRGDKHHNINKISSVYGKDNIKNFVTAQIGKGNLKYIDDKKSLLWSQSRGLKLPKLADTNSGSTDIILQKDDIVNKKSNIPEITQSEPFKKWFGDWENNPDTASKVVNADGTPKVVFRGDANEIDVFDRKKSKYSNLYGRGFYFTDSKEQASVYGDAKEYFLNIKNPLSQTEHTFTKPQIENFLTAIESNEDYDLYNYGEDATVQSIADGLYGRSDFDVLQDISATAIGDLVAATELFNEVNGTQFDGFILPTEMVVFDSTQIKSATDNIGTFDGSNPNVKFSLSTPVEQEKNLVAIHNLSEEKLLKTLKLGGLPMPSIAVAKAEQGHDTFGTISLVMDKSAIDPKRSTANEVYSGDAYTPTYPRIEYEADETVADAVKEKVTKLVPYDVQRQLGFNIPLSKDSITSELNTHGGNITEIYAHSYPMMYAFLKDTGFTEELPHRTQRLDRREKFSNDMIIEIAEELGIDEVEKFRGNVSYGDTELRKLFLDKINKHLEKEYKAKLPEQDIEKLRKIFEYTDDKLSLSDMIDIINGCYDYLQNGVGTEIDYHEARELILKNVDKAAYDKWLLDMLDGIIGKEGIRNNKDIFTPSGNRRKFDALHYEHTLENVIKAMKEQPKQAIGGFTTKNLFGGATQSLKSIAEIKSKSHHLQDISEVEYNKIRDEFNDRYYDLSKRLAIHSEGVWDAGDLLVEAIIKYSTRDGIANYIQREGKGWTNYSPDIVDELIQLVSEIRDMPTRYFEAKPRRAVGFDEVLAAVVPDDVSQTVIDGLRENGINDIITYKADDKADRVAAINQVANAKFSITERSVANEKSDNSFENSRRTDDASAIGQNDPIFKTGKGSLGSYGRKRFVETIRRGQDTEIKTVNNFARCEFIKESSYNEDMELMVADLKKQGFSKVGFFLGTGKIAHTPNGFGAIIFENDGKFDEIYVQYDDADYSPRQLMIHELGHSIYNTKLGQKIKNIIENSLSVAEKKKLLSDDRYQRYMGMLNSEDLVFEELVCDILGGMAPDNVRFEVLSSAFWNNNFEVIDSYKVAEYTESIDAGPADTKIKLSLADDGYFDLIDLAEGRYTDAELRAYAEPTAKKKGAARSNKGTKASRDMDNAASHENRWNTEKVETDEKSDGSPVNIADIVKKISDKFEIPISTGKVNVKDASGIYKERAEAIRTRITNNLPTISHELGHHLDKQYGLSELGSVDALLKVIPSEFLDNYADNEKNGEAVAEFIRVYLKNTNDAHRLCPDFYTDFVRTLSDADLKTLNEIATSVNQYLSSDFSSRVDSAIVSSSKKESVPFRDRWNKIYTDWVDAFHPIKEAVDYVKKVEGGDLSGTGNAYTLATNSLNAHTVANYLICEGFRDLNGNIVDAKSFVDSIGMVDSKDVKLLDKYLVLRHSLEWIAPQHEDVTAKRVFADDTLENVEEIEKQIAEIEKAHPEIKTAAENLYEYQNNVLKYFVIPAGGLSVETLADLNRKYPYYVPFYRAVGKQSGFAKGTFVNQKSPIKRAKGSGALIISPTESIIRNTEKMVKIALRNQTAGGLAHYADTVDGFAQYMEKVTPDMIPHFTDLSEHKEKFADALQQIVKSSDDYFAISEALDTVFGDSIAEFSPIANAGKKIITVLKNGTPSYYQIHDDALYNAVAELTPQQLEGFAKISNMIMQPMKMLTTQNNPLFAATNALRDIGTAYKLSDTNNPIAFAVQYASALKGILTNSEDYKKYKAMGGGHSSELSANIENISRTLRKVAQKDMGKARRLASSIFLHPVETVAHFNALIESTPRFAEFQRTLKAGGDLQEAIFNANDITTNFSKKGGSKAAKDSNSIFMYNNAAIQGLDKLYRTFKDPKKRKSTLLKWSLHALLLAALQQFWNDETDEEGWENLSSYKKNNFYNFAVGDGNFISLPKPRENALLDSFTERTIEYLFGNDEAFYDFGGYVSTQLIPPMLESVPELLQGNLIDAGHSFLGNTVLGGVADIGFNQDFKGTPIESAYDEYSPSNERYTESTTKVAYALGQTQFARSRDLSPKKIDHLISSYTGVLGQVNKALFPVSDERKDTTLGLRNKFISDSNYSTDVLNKMYDNKDAAQAQFQYEPTAENAVEYEQNSIITGYISGMNKAIKALPKDEQRNGRAYLLKSLKDWDYTTTASQEDMLNRLSDESIPDGIPLDSLPKSNMEWTITVKDEYGRTVKGNDGKALKAKCSYQMTPQEYTEYIKDYLTLVEKYRNYQSKATSDTAMYSQALTETDTQVKKVLKEKYQKKYYDKATKAAKN